jgi:P-type E1-E2 ATPase
VISIDIPGFHKFELTDLVLDYNGTLALDGALLPGIAEAVAALARQLRIHVLTADTFGLAESQLAALPLRLTIVPAALQAEAKAKFVSDLNAENVVAIGNGRNDRAMLNRAALGIAIIQREGAAAEALHHADVVCAGILDAFGLLLNPKRLTATLRS